MKYFLMVKPLFICFIILSQECSARIDNFWSEGYLTPDPSPQETKVLKWGEPSTLFEGSDLRLEAELHGSENLWVTFTYMHFDDTLKPGSLTHHQVEKFGGEFFAHRHIDALHVIGYLNDAGHSPEMGTVLQIAKSIINQSHYKNIITYGFSMGGYKAMLFSKELGATMALCFAPQENLSDMCSQWGAYMKPGLQRLFIKRDDLTNCKFLVCFSEKNEFDKGQAQKLQEKYGKTDNLVLWPIPVQEHSCWQALIKTGFFSKIVEMVNAGQITEISSLLKKGEALWKMIESYHM